MPMTRRGALAAGSALLAAPRQMRVSVTGADPFAAQVDEGLAAFRCRAQAPGAAEAVRSS